MTNSQKRQVWTVVLCQMRQALPALCSSAILFVSLSYVSLEASEIEAVLGLANTSAPASDNKDINARTVEAGEPLVVVVALKNRSGRDLRLPQSIHQCRTRDFAIEHSGAQIRDFGESDKRKSLKEGVFTFKDGETITLKVNLLDRFPPIATMGRSASNLYQPGKIRISWSRAVSERDGKLLWHGKISAKPLVCMIRPMREEAVEKLRLQLVKAPKAKRRAKAILLLETYCRQRKPMQVASFLKDGDARIRSSTCWLIGVRSVTGPVITEKLHGVFLGDVDKMVQAFAAVALGKIRDPSTRPIFNEILEKKEGDRRFKATVQAVIEWRDPAFKKNLSQIAKDKSQEEWVRKLAADSLRLPQK